MRPKLLALVVVLLIGSSACRDAAAKPGWWPFGRDDADEPAAANPFEDSARAAPSQVEPKNAATEIPADSQGDNPADSPADSEADERWMIDSPLAKVSWPRLQIPEVPKPHLPTAQLWPRNSDVETDHNAWADEPAAAPQHSPWQAVTHGARRIGDSTRAAWDKTVDTLTPGGNSTSPSSRVARRNDRPSWWKRMFAVEDRDRKEPQTVTEWMAQERLDP